MPFWRSEETCPHCYHVLIRLVDFDARADSVGVDAGRWGPDRGRIGVAITAFEILNIALDRIGAPVKQKRLNGILRAYPNSLYCTGCGYVDRRP